LIFALDEHTNTMTPAELEKQIDANTPAIADIPLTTINKILFT